LRVYLDHNATSPLRPAVKTAMLAALDAGGNASSIHREGRSARTIMDDAREAIALSIGCLPQMIAFTSGGTEGNNWAIRGVGAEHIVVSAIEHPSVLGAAKAAGKSVDVLTVDAQGRVKIDELPALLRRPNTLVSVQLANNETGVVQDIPAIAAIVHGARALLHVDAVQAFKKIPVNLGLLGCDLLTIAAHKAGGPQGTGALVVRDGLVIEPLLQGGGQELRRRAGTENIAAIAGFGALAQEPMLETQTLLGALEQDLRGAVIFSGEATRLPNTSCVALPGMKAEMLLMNLDLEGFAVSSGSACSSGKVGKSHVLAAMGVAPELAACAIRVSLGWNTGAAEIAHFIETLNTLRAKATTRAAA
jgi:cysteine desulfurase